MQLVRYNPIFELQKMEQDLDKLWDNGWSVWPMSMDTSAMDMYEEDGNLVAEVGLPRFKKDEVKVMADAGVLEITAKHNEQEDKKDSRHHYLQESSNTYFRRISLPKGADTAKVDATFKGGVLKISMPMSASSEAKEITVK